MFFFKQFWETIKDDIFILCDDFYAGKANLERINWANIALIPKVESPESPGDYMPISLINSSLKIISKLLATRLGKVMDDLVDTAQSAFLKGRCILDNVAIAVELIFSMKKRRMPGYILKVDFAKAFDLEDWEFLLDLLKARGFGTKWLGWIGRILSSTKANVLVYGSPNGYIRYYRGLRQGDPLSPLLFILVTDVLCTMFRNALDSKVLVGVPLGLFRNRCNLHFADDLLVLTSGGLEDLKIVKLLLYMFECLSGLQVNFSKTCLFSVRTGVLQETTDAETLNCATGILTVTYLGIRLYEGRPRKQDWEGLITKVR